MLNMVKQRCKAGGGQCRKKALLVIDRSRVSLTIDFTGYRRLKMFWVPINYFFHFFAFLKSFSVLGHKVRLLCRSIYLISSFVH